MIEHKKLDPKLIDVVAEVLFCEVGDIFLLDGHIPSRVNLAKTAVDTFDIRIEDAVLCITRMEELYTTELKSYGYKLPE